MYFDFEDYRPDISPVGRAMSAREGVLISIIVHLALVILILLAPKWMPQQDRAALLQQIADAQQAPRNERFVFVNPRVDKPAPRPPERAERSDKDRIAEAPRRAPEPENPLPFSRGNSVERVEELEKEMARDQGPAPEPSPGQQSPPQADVVQPVPEGQTARQLPPPATQPTSRGSGNRAAPAGGSLGEALRNLQRYVQREQFENPQGGGGSFGPAIQFDTKGVEFGPWIRRFIAQVKRNWLIPYAAMSMSGRVIITFNVHKDGFITDLSVIGPSPIDAFNNAAFGALSASNPTAPLPPEYPTDRAFFTVTFFYNEPPQ